MTSKIARINLVSSHPEVYEPCDDSFALVDAILADRANLFEHHPSICMEVGCGSGYVITSLVLLLGKGDSSSYYIATDINLHAVRVTRETLEAHRCHAEVINTDIASGLEERLARSVDVMVVNPPYVPTPEEEVGCGGIASAWAGGENGRTIMDRILPVADQLLSDKGWLYLVTLASNNPLEICLEMRKKGYASHIILQRSTEEESLHVILTSNGRGGTTCLLSGKSFSCWIYLMNDDGLLVQQKPQAQIELDSCKQLTVQSNIVVSYIKVRIKRVQVSLW